MLHPVFYLFGVLGAISVPGGRLVWLGTVVIKLLLRKKTDTVDAAPLKLEGIPLELQEVAYWSLCERQIIPRAGDPDAIEPGIARG